MREIYSITKAYRVTMEDIKIHPYVKYHKEIKFLGITLQHSGFYLDGISYKLDKDKDFIKDNVMYSYPCITLYYTNFDFKKVYYKSLKEVEDIYETINNKSKIVWIPV